MSKNKPRYRFCWACSRKLYGNSHALRFIDGYERILHGACAEEIDAGIEIEKIEKRPLLK